MAKESDNAKDYLLDSDRNIFLTGKAGTGKTYQIARFVEEMNKRHKQVMVCAPTGAAAVNAGGETAHSLFGIPIPCYGVSISKVQPAKIKTLAMADAVVIDEISMMRNDNFSFAMRVLKKAEKIKGKKIRVILVGDFSQLPPVVTKKDLPFLKKFGYDPSGYAFTTKEWAALKLKTVELTEIYRQKEDKELAEKLGQVQVNDLSCMGYFQQFVREGYAAKEDEIQICGTNAEADEINRNYLDRINSPMIAYQAVKKGRTGAGICDDIILLKKGARVMFQINDVKTGKYRNGTTGTIENLNEKCVAVRLDNGEIIPVFPHEYKVYSYRVVGGNLTRNEIGSVTQMPIKVAKAITIHKSQGKTFEKAVITPTVFAPGQLYVALSRITSPAGLVLTKELRPEYFRKNEIVDKFIENGYTYDIPAAKKQPAAKKPAAKSKSGSKTAAGKKKTASKTTARKNTKTAAVKKTKTAGSRGGRK